MKKLEELKTRYRHCFKDKQGRLQGEYKSWWDNGNLEEHCFYVDGDYHGEYKHYWYNGNLRIQVNYLDDMMQGEYKKWWANGQLWEKAFYRDYCMDGEYKQWDRKGNLRIHSFFRDDVLHGECKTWSTRNRTLKTHCFYVNNRKVSFKKLPYPVTPEDQMYFTLKYDIPLLPVEQSC